MNAGAGNGNLFLPGTRSSGQDVRTENITAIQAVANIVRSSLGPVGLDKMLIDETGEITITNDGATILSLLEVEHPAAQILVELSQLQDQEVGDGTTTVVILAAELLKRANDLVRNKIHPTSIISGYRLAMKEACKYIEDKMATPVDSLGREVLINAAKTSMSSKIVGTDSDYFAQMLVDAMLAVKTINNRGDVKYPVKNVSILKAHGKSSKESKILDGYAVNVARSAQGMPTAVKNCKVAVLDMNLNKQRMQQGVQVLVTNPKELEMIRSRESDVTRDRIMMMINAGANVIFTTKGIDDMALKYFVENNCIACRRVSKDDCRRICKATGAKMVTSFADMDSGETFEPACLGECEECTEERVSDDQMIMMKGCKNGRASTLLLRGANDYMLDEMERSFHDVLCVIKRVLESGSVVAGGGAVDAALSVYQDSLSTTLGSREQLANAEFAEALLVIPRTLSVNAAKDATDLVAKLCAYHHAAQTRPGKEHLKGYGLDLVNGEVVDNFKLGVIEPALSKLKAIQFATEAAITIIRIDDKITLSEEN